MIGVAFEPLLNTQGGLDGVFVGGPTGSILSSGTLKTAEVFSDGGVAIGRWTDGTASVGGNPASPFFSPAKKDSFTLNANQGLHYAIGSVVDVLPITGGRANFTLSSADRPTYADGHTAPGTLNSAKLSVIFGSAPRIGFEASVSFADANYTLSTSGGIADLALVTSKNSLGGFTRIDGLGNFTGYLTVCKNGDCGGTSNIGNFYGAFSADLTRSALVYSSDTSNRGFSGAAAFYLSGANGLSLVEPTGMPVGSSAASGLTNGTNGLAFIGLLPADNGVVEGLALFPSLSQAYDATGALQSIGTSRVNVTRMTCSADCQVTGNPLRRPLRRPV